MIAQRESMYAVPAFNRPRRTTCRRVEPMHAQRPYRPTDIATGTLFQFDPRTPPSRRSICSHCLYYQIQRLSSRLSSASSAFTVRRMLAGVTRLFDVSAARVCGPLCATSRRQTATRPFFVARRHGEAREPLGEQGPQEPIAPASAGMRRATWRMPVGPGVGHREANVSNVPP
jgi:hypothetical protein